MLFFGEFSDTVTVFARLDRVFDIARLVLSVPNALLRYRRPFGLDQFADSYGAVLFNFKFCALLFTLTLN